MNNGLPAPSSLSPEWLGILALLGAVLLVMTGAIIWAVFFRKKEKPRSRRHRHRRASRREHRPINPTLSQTGGLPPVRQEEKPFDQPPPTFSP